MDADTIAIILIVTGVLLLTIELLSPGFFAVIPGAVMTVVGIIGYYVEDFFKTWHVFATAIIMTIAVSIATIKWYHKLATAGF